ncbi:hypothetical protein BN2476_170198 [Paraburkholderia piptadeniae]|uniref:Uncharacterized protein n=1 Tax=Paraburkholderia piptadeniae TaxID=1701573 RepID=A0A1N7RTZ1_9BURK|nr:hypothetical protein BN2476_170198 [Paraburkholderia piptadeniae]
MSKPPAIVSPAVSSPHSSGPAFPPIADQTAVSESGDTMYMAYRRRPHNSHGAENWDLSLIVRQSN